MTPPHPRRRRELRRILLARVIARYRRLGFQVHEGRLSGAGTVAHGRWLSPDFSVESRPHGIVRLGFVEAGPGIPPLRVDHWEMAAGEGGVEVAVHCRDRITHLVRWWCAVRGLDLLIRPEPWRTPVTPRNVSQPAESDRRFDRTSATPSRGPRRILVVDDDPAVCAFLTESLNRGDMVVRVAGDAVEAMRLAIAEPPDLILCDVVLPGDSGFVLCKRLRIVPALRDVPMVMMTGYADRDALPSAFHAGAVDFIRKPLDPTELVVRIGHHINQARRCRMGGAEAPREVNGASAR